MQQTSTAAPAASKHYTVADVLRELQQRVPRKRFIHLAYRIEWICKLMGEVPSKLPLDIPELRKRIAAIDLVKAGMTSRTFQGLLWTFRYALETSSYLDTEFKGRVALLAPEWKEVLAKAADPNARATLSRLAYYCSRRGIAPWKVDREIFCQFETSWHDTRLLQNQPIHSRKLARRWDELATQFPELRLTPLGIAMPKRELKYIPYAQLPGALRHEVEHMLAARQSQEVLGDHTFTRPIGPASAEQTKRRVQVAVDALVRAGEPLAHVTSLAILTSPEPFRRILQVRNNDKGRKASHENWYLASTLRQIAKHWVRRAPEELDNLKKIHELIHDPRGSMGRSYAELLLQFDDPEVIRNLTAAPFRIWNQVRTEERVSGHTLARAQSAIGLAIEMKNAPMFGVLATLSLDKHFELDADSKTGWLVLGRDETPSGEGLRSPLSPEIVTWLLEYRDRIYPAVAGKPPTHLFSHRDGRLKTKMQVRDLIKFAASRYASVKVTPHMFRPLAGLMMIKNGATIEEVAAALGVKDVESLARQFEDILRDRDVQEFADSLDQKPKPSHEQEN